ncbi:MAG: cytochrome c [Gemmatimonadaceae bacterium]|nr:cytochrome c [Gemmatimonadaceae bacterium]
MPATARLLLPIALGALVCGSVLDARPRQPNPRTTMDGVYTAAQATDGADIFAAYCRNCHTPTVHAGPPFKNKWYGRTLGELFGYLRREMPKSDPGSMSDQDYSLALAYLLKINGMPAGSEPLAADSTVLHSIRLDSVRSVTPTTSLR